MTKRAILLVQTNPVSPERELEFNEWYDRVHVPQVLSNVDGITGATRFVVAASSPTAPAHRYLAVYEIEADEPGEVVRSLGEAMAAGTLDVTDAIDTSIPGTMELYEAIEPQKRPA